MNILETVVLYYNHSAEKDIYHETARQLLCHLHELEHATIYDMAELCIVSTTTISRFVRHLGCRNYAEFKTRLVDIIKNYHYHNLLFPLSTPGAEDSAVDSYLDLLMEDLQSFREEMHTFDIAAITAAMHEAEHVNFFLYANCGQEFFLQMDLIVSGVQTSIYTDPLQKHSAARELTDRDMAVILLPNIRENELERDVLEIAAEQGAKILLITNIPTNHRLPAVDFLYNYHGTATISDSYKINLFINVLSLEYRHHYLQPQR